MSGKILQAARRDFQKIISSGGFEEDIELVSPDGSVIIEITGLHAKRAQMFDTEGNPVSSIVAHITVMKNKLDELNYPYINSKGKVDFNGHKVNVKDFSVIRNYVVNEFHPSDTFGAIVLILGNNKIS